MVKNLGISFGISFLGDWWWGILMWLALGWWWWRTKNRALLLILVGGGLNIWERLTLGYVRDYWRIPGTNIYNNINDWLIFVGLIIFIGSSLWKKK